MTVLVMTYVNLNDSPGHDVCQPLFQTRLSVYKGTLLCLLQMLAQTEDDFFVWFYAFAKIFTLSYIDLLMILAEIVSKKCVRLSHDVR